MIRWTKSWAPLLSSRLGISMRASRGWAGVEVAEPTAPHGGGLAVESAGHDVTTFVGHEVLSYTGTGVSPHPPRWVWRKLPVFNALEAEFYRK
jgi:hypothetical protein